MKKSILFHSLFYIIIFIFSLTSCELKNIDEAIDNRPNTSNFESAETYIYQLPTNSQNLLWEYDNIICDVKFNSFDLSSYIIDNYNAIIPKEICIMIEKLLIKSLDNNLSFNGEFYEHAYLSTIEYFPYDLNNDGLTNYLTKGIVGIHGSGGGAGQYASAIYIAQNNGTYKEIICALDYNVSIMGTMTNGVYDILIGYLGNDICKFDGIDSYTIPYRSSKLFYTQPEIHNNIVEFSFTLDTNTEIIPFDKFYVLIYSNDKRLKNKILCSSDEFGNPKIYTKANMEFNENIYFYAEYIDNSTIEDVDYIDFKQLKFFPADGHY